MVDIYGTIGPSCSSQETLTEMFRAGMTGVRLNLSHISLRESAEQIEKLHSAAHTAGVNPILLIDMQGPELRIGRLKEALVLLEKEKAVLFCEKIKAEELLKYCGEGRPAIPVPEAVCAPLEKEMEVLLDDGRISLKITEGKGDYAEAEVVRGGILTGRKSVKVPGLDIQMPTLTYADIENIRDAASYGVTGIMQPFVRGREDLDTVHRVLSENSGRHLRVVAKIENQAGMERLDSLLPPCDAICIARDIFCRTRFFNRLRRFFRRNSVAFFTGSHRLRHGSSVVSTANGSHVTFGNSGIAAVATGEKPCAEQGRYCDDTPFLYGHENLLKSIPP